MKSPCSYSCQCQECYFWREAREEMKTTASEFRRLLRGFFTDELGRSIKISSLKLSNEP